MTVVGEMVEADRFMPLVLPLFDGESANLQNICLTLLNVIICAPTGDDDVDFRMHLRNEILRTGMRDALDVSAACFTSKEDGLCCRNSSPRRTLAFRSRWTSFAVYATTMPSDSLIDSM